MQYEYKCPYCSEKVFWFDHDFIPEGTKDIDENTPVHSWWKERLYCDCCGNKIPYENLKKILEYFNLEYIVDLSNEYVEAYREKTKKEQEKMLDTLDKSFKRWEKGKNKGDVKK